MNYKKRKVLFVTLVGGHVTEPGGYSYLENTGAVFIKESKGRDTFVGNVDRDFPLPKDSTRPQSRSLPQVRFPVTKRDVLDKDPTGNPTTSPSGHLPFKPSGH